MDADVAIDAMMWQNGGMCGLDHWNFVMHPVDAAMTCDPHGTYVRRWCQELSALPDELIHKPWKCPVSVLRRAGEELVYFKKQTNKQVLAEHQLFVVGVQGLCWVRPTLSG